jgi:hypothetical protein
MKKLDNEIEPVEPILKKESMDYINSFKEPREENVDEFLDHVIGKDKNKWKENLANFAIVIDQLSRSDPIFKSMGILHVKALEANEEYSKLHEEIFAKDSELMYLVKQRSKWIENQKKESQEKI